MTALIAATLITLIMLILTATATAARPRISPTREHVDALEAVEKERDTINREWGVCASRMVAAEARVTKLEEGDTT